MEDLIGNLTPIFNKFVEFLKSDTFKSLTEGLKTAVSNIKWDEVLATLKQLLEGAGSLINK